MNRFSRRSNFKGKARVEREAFYESFSAPDGGADPAKRGGAPR